MSYFKDKIMQVPLFDAFSPPLRAHLADVLLDIGQRRVLKKGEQLYAEGAADDNTGAVLLDGGLIVAFSNKSPLLLHAPNLVGEMQQFNEFGTRTATVSAEDPTTIIEFGWHDFVARIQDHADISDADQDLIRNAFTKFAGDRFMRR